MVSFDCITGIVADSSFGLYVFIYSLLNPLHPEIYFRQLLRYDQSRLIVYSFMDALFI